LGLIDRLLPRKAHPDSERPQGAYIVIVLSATEGIDDLVGPFNTFNEAESWAMKRENPRCEVFQLSTPELSS
jgi:hypothetical protein